MMIKKMALVFVALSTYACDNYMQHTRCDDKVVQERASPSGKYIATLYQRSCANGTSSYTGVRLSAAQSAATSGHVESGEVMTIRGVYEIDARWADDTHLEVATTGLQQQKPDELAAFPPKNSWQGINISYK
jgi:hypothetical protein